MLELRARHAASQHVRAVCTSHMASGGRTETGTVWRTGKFVTRKLFLPKTNEARQGSSASHSNRVACSDTSASARTAWLWWSEVPCHPAIFPSPVNFVLISHSKLLVGSERTHYESFILWPMFLLSGPPAMCFCVSVCVCVCVWLCVV